MRRETRSWFGTQFVFHGMGAIATETIITQHPLIIFESGPIIEPLSFGYWMAFVVPDKDLGLVVGQN